jgi:hypothetical protein
MPAKKNRTPRRRADPDRPRRPDRRLLSRRSGGSRSPRRTTRRTPSPTASASISTSTASTTAARRPARARAWPTRSSRRTSTTTVERYNPILDKEARSRQGRRGPRLRARDEHHQPLRRHVPDRHRRAGGEAAGQVLLRLLRRDAAGFVAVSAKKRAAVLGAGFAATAAWMLVDQYVLGHLETPRQAYMSRRPAPSSRSPRRSRLGRQRAPHHHGRHRRPDRGHGRRRRRRGQAARLPAAAGPGAGAAAGVLRPRPTPAGCGSSATTCIPGAPSR